MNCHTFVVPRITIADDQELRVSIDVDPDGNRALRLELFQPGRRTRRLQGPLWVNLRALETLRADFAF